MMKKYQTDPDKRFLPDYAKVSGCLTWKTIGFIAQARSSVPKKSAA